METPVIVDSADTSGFVPESLGRLPSFDAGHVVTNIVEFARAEHAMHRISGLLVTWPLTS